MASDERLKMVEMAIKATQTCAFFGHEEVVSNGLTKDEYNGMRGTLGGYVAEKERRVMHPIAGPAVEHELALKLENISLSKRKTTMERSSNSAFLKVPLVLEQILLIRGIGLDRLAYTRLQ
jgi:hypothetical protein